MCFELCGPADSSPEELKAYSEWLDSEYPEKAGLFEPQEVSSESDETEDEDDTPEVLTESESYDRYDDFLNECWEPVILMGVRYDTAQVLKSVDPIMYREEYNNWLDAELQEGSFTLAD